MFSSFPHKQLVVPIVVLATSTSECTCTLLWLLRYTKFYFNFNLFQYRDNIDTINTLDNNQTAVSVCFRTSNIHGLMESCNFTEKFNKCIVNKADNSVDYSTKTKFSLFNENINLLYTLKWFQYLIEVYIRTILCSLGLITNILTLIVIHNKRQLKHFKHSTYKHISFNAFFNILFCLIHLLSLMNICIFPKSSFCSSAWRTEFAQYFHIYVIQFLGNSLRLCCNSSYIFFSLSRFALSGTSSENKLRKFIGKWGY